ncbi:MAG: hypothetical protein WBM43_06215, partial [Flavobacteriaceae bacterium]
ICPHLSAGDCERLLWVVAKIFFLHPPSVNGLKPTQNKCRGVNYLEIMWYLLKSLEHLSRKCSK